MTMIENDSLPAGDELPAAPETAPRSAGRRLAQRQINDRVTLYLVRGLFFLITIGIGLYAFRSLSPTDALSTILGACGLAAVLLVVEIFLLSRIPVRTLAAISIGLMTGMLLALVIHPVIDLLVNAIVDDAPRAEGGMTRDALRGILQLLTTSILCYLTIAILMQTKDDFKFLIPYVEFRKDLKGHTPLILDTSALIDGRIAPLLQTRILDHRLLVPRFVLSELQGIADSSDRSMRERGRRGMDILHDIRRRFDVEIIERDLGAGGLVDRELLAVAEEEGGKILTTDLNLEKRARLQGIVSINLNDLATAMKPVVVPGEELRLRLLREGDVAGQGVGYLRDGTMVVVEGGAARIGQDVVIEVTSATQTSAGKMVFGKLRGAPAQPRRGRNLRRRRRPDGDPAAAIGGTMDRERDDDGG